MRARSNDCLRWLLGVAIAGIGFACAMIHRVTIATYYRAQKQLRRRYRIRPETPVLPYGPQIEQLIRDAAVRHGANATYALTSGSTAAPKRILYTKRRLLSTHWVFIDFFVRAYAAHRVRRKSLYVFSSFGKDESLTSMLLAEKRLPSYLVTLQAPYRVERHPAIQDLGARYGTAAVRLWVLTLANPGVLYSTNPSTLWLFLHEVATNWQRSRRLIQDFRNKPELFHGTIHAIARRLQSCGSDQRIARIAAADGPLPLSAFAPGVEAYVCWTGGYVKPFLDRLANYLPPDRYQLIPLHSMSTETIETISYSDRGASAFLPMGKHVLYEFIEEGDADDPSNLRTPDELQPMKSYSMVVSDPFGLRRYQTEDVFLCKGFSGKLPDLRFLRRRNLEYSFTGEKLSSEHLDLVFRRLREECGALLADAFLTCVPSHPHDEPIPHYNVVLAGGSGSTAATTGAAIAARCDRLLQEANVEYRNKRAGGRLGAVRFAHLSFDDFTTRFSGSRDSTACPGQFKFLPLYRRTWEETLAPS